MIHQKYLAFIKVLDAIVRGVFILFCTFNLPLEEAGKFGLFVTCIGLLSFVLAYERHIDVQRQVAGRSSFAVRSRITDLVHFFLTHYLAVLPISLLAAVWIGVSEWMLALALIIVVGEHVSNQAYLASLVSRRAFFLMVAVFAKNSAVLAVAFFFSWNELNGLNIVLIFEAWAIFSMGYLLVALAFYWLWILEPLLLQGDELPAQTVYEQYCASIFNFLVGVVAIVALQADRLIVGAMLSPSEIGVYFRNIAIAGLVLQMFNIVIFNRIAPLVYQLAREDRFNKAKTVVFRECRYFSFLVCLLANIAFVTNYSMGDVAARWGVQTSYVIVIFITVLVRTQADCCGLLLLSVSKDRSVFANQSLAVVLGIMITFCCVYFKGLIGAFIGTFFTQLIYLVLNGLSLRKTVFNRMKTIY